MEVLQSFLFLFGGIGVINGTVVALFLLINEDKKTKDVFLGALILAICIRIGKSIYFNYTDDYDRLILQIGLSACLFIGPLFYAYVKTIRQPSTAIPLFIQTGMAFLFIVSLTVGSVYPYRNYPEYWNGPIIKSIYLVWLIFLFSGLYEIADIFKKTYYQPKALNRLEKRLLGVAVSIVFITCSYQFAFWINGFTYLWASLIFTSVFYYLIYVEISDLLSNQRRKKVLKTDNLPDGTALLQRVENAMQKEKLHRKSSLKLKDLAQATNISSHHLSRVLNQVYPHGFATYVNEKRIEEAKQLMQSNTEYTLEGIGYEAGFNSKSSFYATFKKLTGCTPAEYKNNLSSAENQLK